MNCLRTWCRRGAAAAALGVLAGLTFGGRFSQAEPQPPQEKSRDKESVAKFKFLAFDPFDGKINLKWQPVRYDPTHVSVTKHPGKLTITTQRGTIHADETIRGEPSAKNIYLIDNPLYSDADFVVTTCVSDFVPTMAYQQAGLICYDDDDNYAKWAYEFDWSKRQGQRFVFVTETEAKSTHHYAGGESGLKRFWLRLTKRQSLYEFAASSDGKTFTVFGEKPWSDGKPKKIGILAKNGGPQGVAEIDANFEFFELRSPAPARSTDDMK